MNDDFTVRTMSRAELDLAIDWAAGEGWNPGLHDAGVFHLQDPDGYLVGLHRGVPVGSISVVRYGAAFGFLGFFIVKPEVRGSGIGRRMWNAGMHWLDGRTVGLDGVVTQQGYYRAAGFAYAYPNHRFVGRIEAKEDGKLIPAREVPFDDLQALDDALFPVPRPSFLSAWLSMPDSRSLASVKDGRVTGLGTARRCREGVKIGPLYAGDEAEAERLARALAALAPEGPHTLDVPGPNEAAMRLAERLGMKATVETARMYRGPAPQVAPGRVFGVTSFELG